MTIMGVQIDVHCDDGCDRDSVETVVDERDGTVMLKRECCGAEVEMTSRDFNEYLRECN